MTAHLSPQLSPAQMSEAIRVMIGTARDLGGTMPIQDHAGATIATLQVHDVARRPVDMPRHLRPKPRLSKRERDAAKREKLGQRGPAAGPV